MNPLDLIDLIDVGMALSMAVLALALLGNRIDLLPAATAGTALFVALMWASGRIEQDL